MTQTITFDGVESDAQVFQDLLAKARTAGKSVTEMLTGLKDNEQPLTLAVDGETVVIQGLASYEKLLEERETAEVIAGIQRGLESMRAGGGKPVKEAFEEIRQRLDLPERDS